MGELTVTETGGGGCWSCGQPMLLAMDPTLGSRRPRPGEPTLCGTCGAIHVFDDGLVARKPGEDRLAVLEREPGIRGIQGMIRRFHAETD